MALEKSSKASGVCLKEPAAFPGCSRLRRSSGRGGASCPDRRWLRRNCRCVYGVGEFVRRVGVDRNSLIGIVQARNEVDHFGPCHGPVEVEERIGGIVCDSRRIGADRIGELSDQRLRNGILYLQEPVARILAQDFGIAAVEHRQRVRTDVRRPVGEDEVGIVQFFSKSLTRCRV